MYETADKIRAIVKDNKWEDEDLIVINFGRYGNRDIITTEYITILPYGKCPQVAVMIEADYIVWRLSTNISVQHTYKYNWFLMKLAMCEKEFPKENPLAVLFDEEEDPIAVRYPDTGWQVGRTAWHPQRKP